MSGVARVCSHQDNENFRDGLGFHNESLSSGVD